MNRIIIGTKRSIEIPRGNCLVICDELIPTKRRVQLFDYTRHGFNPLSGLDYRKACELVDIIGALFPGGDETLTKTTGLEAIFDALDASPTSLDGLIQEPDKKSTTGHFWAYGKVRRIMRSPMLRKMLTARSDFVFNPRSVILARVNRKELGSFDAKAVALFLMMQFKGQICVPDYGSYAIDMHSSLLDEGRLIAGVNYLDEMPEKLQKRFLLLPQENIIAEGALFDDAVLLAKRRGYIPQTNEFNDDVKTSIG